VLAAIIAALWRPLGVGEYASELRRQFVALRYVQEANAAMLAPPVHRSRVRHMLDRAVSVAPDNELVIRRAATGYMAIHAYEECVALLGRTPDRDLLADAHYAHSLLAMGNVQEGLRVTDRILQQAREQRQTGRISSMMYRMLLNDIGYGYALAGVRLEEAEGLVREAMSANPMQPAVIDSMGWVYYRLGDFRQSLFYLQRAVRMMGDQENAEIYYHVGAAYSKTGRVRKAREAFKRCLALDPEFKKAREELKLLGIKLPEPQSV
jgi:tetratricopeptide (TPR) repeat protein